MPPWTVENYSLGHLTAGMGSYSFPRVIVHCAPLLRLRRSLVGYTGICWCWEPRKEHKILGAFSEARLFMFLKVSCTVSALFGEAAWNCLFKTLTSTCHYPYLQTRRLGSQTRSIVLMLWLCVISLLFISSVSSMLGEGHSFPVFFLSFSLNTQWITWLCLWNALCPSENE